MNESLSYPPLALYSSPMAQRRLDALLQLIAIHGEVVAERIAAGVEVRDEIGTALASLAASLRVEVNGPPDARQNHENTRTRKIDN